MTEGPSACEQHRDRHIGANDSDGVTPTERFTGGIHIYGGDFFATERSQWDPETLDEEPSDGASIQEMFQRENERYRSRSAG